MAGRAEIPADAGAVLDRCFLLNESNQWEPYKKAYKKAQAFFTRILLCSFL